MGKIVQEVMKERDALCIGGAVMITPPNLVLSVISPHVFEMVRHFALISRLDVVRPKIAPKEFTDAVLSRRVAGSMAVLATGRIVATTERMSRNDSVRWFQQFSQLFPLLIHR